MQILKLKINSLVGILCLFFNLVFSKLFGISKGV
jgi:hypothetical protein